MEEILHIYPVLLIRDDRYKKNKIHAGAITSITWWQFMWLKQAKSLVFHLFKLIRNDSLKYLLLAVLHVFAVIFPFQLSLLYAVCKPKLLRKGVLLMRAVKIFRS